MRFNAEYDETNKHYIELKGELEEQSKVCYISVYNTHNIFEFSLF